MVPTHLVVSGSAHPQSRLRGNGPQGGQDRVEALLSILREMEAERLRVQTEQVRRDRERELTERRRGEGLGRAAHDLRTPITTLTGYLELMADGGFGELSATAADKLTMLIARAGEVQALVESIIDQARTPQTPPSRAIRPVELGALTSRVVARYQALHPELAIEIRSASGPPLTVLADEDHISLVVSLLLAGAVARSSERGPVQCRVGVEDTPSGRFACVAVRDHGPVVSEEEQERLLTDGPGTVSGAATAPVEGSLFVAREVARAHGGDISVATSPGQGFTLTLHLPLERDRQAAAAA